MARPKSDIQARVVAAAHQRFLAEGVDAASLRAIAKDAETSIGMVYYYYPTKEDLFFAVVEEAYADILNDFEVGLSQGATFRDKLRVFYSRIARITPHELEIVRLVLREVMTNDERRKRLLTRFLNGHILLLFTAIQDAMRSGELDRNQSPLLALGAALGIGGACSVIVRLAQEHSGVVVDEQSVPEEIRQAARNTLADFAAPESLVQALCGLTLRALGSAPTCPA